MKKRNFKITVKILTGLHIGSGDDKIQIGGVDSAVIKDPITNLPYIPGSSLKGKIRCLLETEGGYPNGEKEEILNRCFGINNIYKKMKDDENKKKKDKNENAEEYQTPTRFVFRDLFLIEDDANNLNSGNINTEFKTEIVINRTKGTAKDGGLRTIERVPPSLTFEGNLLIRYTTGNEFDKIKNVLDNGINLLNNDYLGGSGSRGYGAVEIKIEEKK